jgi:Leucine-rich repeat (LRR) protein
MRILLAIVLCTGLYGASGDHWIVQKGGTIKQDAQGRVTEVNLSGTWIADSDLPALREIESIQKLDLSHTRITDLGFQQLRPLPNVTELNLYYAEQIGDEALATVKGWKNLRWLNVRGTKITDAGLAQLAGLPLEHIDVGFSLFTDNGFDHFTAIPGLSSIACGGNKVTDVGMNALRPLADLKALDLSGAQRTDSGLWAAIITDKGLDSIAQLRNLESLNLRASKITDAGSGKLRSLKALRELNLAETQLSAKGLAFLPELPGLEKLSLWKSAKIDDEAVPILTKLPKLRWLDVKETKLTPQAIERLRRDGLEILY